MTFALKVATALFAKLMEKLQHTKWLKPECQSYVYTFRCSIHL